LNPEYERQFQQWIVEPLQNVIGQPLLSVLYYVLHVDYAGFDVDAPNASGGCQGVRLIFADGELELDWDWQSIFRAASDDFVSPPIVYHLVARSASERQATVRITTEDDWSAVRVVHATEGLPWKDVSGEALLDATVWGILLPEERYSPQAVTLRFPSAQVVVALGMTADLSIGDGDEILVFTETEWTQQITTQMPGLMPRQDVLVAFWSTGDSGG
jgi:hypothetical protein